MTQGNMAVWMSIAWIWHKSHLNRESLQLSHIFVIRVRLSKKGPGSLLLFTFFFLLPFVFSCSLLRFNHLGPFSHWNRHSPCSLLHVHLWELHQYPLYQSPLMSSMWNIFQNVMSHSKYMSIIAKETNGLLSLLFYLWILRRDYLVITIINLFFYES